MLKYSHRQLSEVLTGEFYLEFEDGQLLTNDRETNFTMPMWDWIRKRPIPLKKRHHISNSMAKKTFHKNMHMDLLNIIHWDIYEAYKKTGRFGDYDLLEELTKEFYEYGNVMYNLLAVKMGTSVSTVSIKDVIKLFKVPEIADLLEKMRPTEESVLGTTQGITKLISKSTNPEIMNNRAVRMARAGVIKTNQLVQAIAPTGYIEDLGGEIFKYPLMSNYTDGHRSLYDNMVESRKASQAIEATKAELEDAVYQSRRQEILNEILMNVHPGDCGTKGFIPYKIRETNDLTASDLELNEGKYYMLPEDPTETLYELKSTDEHLIGKIIHMRSILHCAHPDPNGVCESCLGAISLTIPKRTNLGQLMTTDLYAFIIQRQLSKKHYLANSVVQKLRVAEEDAQYLEVGRDGISYYFTENLKGLNYKMIISHDEGKSLTDVMYLTDIDRVSIGRITEIGSMALEIEHKGKVEYVDRRPFILGTGKRMASFSHDMLKYVKEQYWEIDDKNNFVIDMSNWDYRKPFAFVPMKNDSLIDFSLGFKSHIESEVKKEEIRDQFTDVDAFLIDTYELLNSELTINMAQVEVAVYGISIRSAKYGDYSLPKPWSKRGIGVMSRAMAMRSLGSTMAFEKHTIIFSSVESFIVKNRPDHPFDAILNPELLPRV
ncbi:hypothetical protein [Ralstonia phage RSL2]|uniref:RNA polymerase beta prime subunit n=2 Tax=Ralstonia phage RSL2 TaxID=1585840 RepID=A0A0A8JBG2_9CAUD|nr:hypothetical protein [Ralstonia phage RSL2]